MNKEEFINSKMKLSKEDIIYDYYNAEEKLIEKLGIEHKIYELEQQCKKQKEIINKAINNIVKETKSMPTNGCKIRLIEILDILKEVSK